MTDIITLICAFLVGFVVGAELVLRLTKMNNNELVGYTTVNVERHIAEKGVVAKLNSLIFDTEENAREYYKFELDSGDIVKISAEIHEINPDN